MKKKLFLQLFAETGSETKGTDPNGMGTEGKETEEINSKGEGDEKKYTDADIDEIISRKFAKWQKEQQKKTDEAAKLAEMNATEKAKYEKDKLERMILMNLRMILKHFLSSRKTAAEES